MRQIYLAGPYTDKNSNVVQKRIDGYADVVAHYIDSSPNLFIFSPILHHFYVAEEHDMPHDFEFWAQRDFFMIKKSAAMWVYTMPGWDKSYGLSQEIEYADSIGRDVLYLNKYNGIYVLRDTRPPSTNGIGE